MDIGGRRALRRRAMLLAVAPLVSAGVLTSPLAAHADSGEATISGTVRYHGAPVAGVDVWLATDTSLISLGESAANGGFSSDAVIDPAGHYWIAAGEQRNRFATSARKYVLGFVGQTGTPAQAQPYRDLVQPIAGSALAGGVSDVTVETIRPGGIAGALTGGAGRTIELTNRGGDRITEAKAGKTGTFAFHDLTPGEYRLAVEPKDGYSDQLHALTNDVVTVTSGSTSRYSGRIASGTRIRGRLLVNGSAPKARGTGIHISDALGGNAQVLSAGADGSFTTRQLPAGTYSVSAMPSTGLDDSTDLVGASARVVVSAGATPDPVTIRLHSQGHATLVGSITRRDTTQTYGEVVVERLDRSVVRAQSITLRGATTSYRVPGLPAGTYHVVVATDRGGEGFSYFATRKVALHSGRTTSAGSLSPRTKALTMRVAAVPRPSDGDYFGVDLDAVGNDGPGASGVFSKAGVWNARGLLPGRYEIRASYGPGDSNDRAPLALRTVELTSNTSLTADLAKASGSVSFRVQYPFDYGQDVCLTAYTTLKTALGETISAYSPTGGSFTLKYLRPGRYSWSSMLNCTSEPMWLRAAGGFTVVAGKAADLGTIALAPNYG